MEGLQEECLPTRRVRCASRTASWHGQGLPVIIRQTEQQLVKTLAKGVSYVVSVYNRRPSQISLSHDGETHKLTLNDCPGITNQIKRTGLQHIRMKLTVLYHFIIIFLKNIHMRLFLRVRCLIMPKISSR